jgi:hypothetical protein
MYKWKDNIEVDVHLALGYALDYRTRGWQLVATRFVTHAMVWAVRLRPLPAEGRV